MTKVRATTGLNDPAPAAGGSSTAAPAVLPAAQEDSPADPSALLQRALEAHRERHRTQRFRLPPASIRQDNGSPIRPAATGLPSVAPASHLPAPAPSPAFADTVSEDSSLRARERLLLAMLLPAIGIASMLLLGPAVMGRREGAPIAGAPSAAPSTRSASVEAIPSRTASQSVAASTSEIQTQSRRTPDQPAAARSAGAASTVEAAVAQRVTEGRAAEQRAAELALAERERRIAEQRAARLRAAARRERKRRRERRIARQAVSARAAHRAIAQEKQKETADFVAARVPHHSALPVREPFGWVSTQATHHRSLPAPP